MANEHAGRPSRTHQLDSARDFNIAASVHLPRHLRGSESRPLGFFSFPLHCLYFKVIYFVTSIIVGSKSIS